MPSLFPRTVMTAAWLRLNAANAASASIDSLKSGLSVTGRSISSPIPRIKGEQETTCACQDMLSMRDGHSTCQDIHIYIYIYTHLYVYLSISLSLYTYIHTYIYVLESERERERDTHTHVYCQCHESKPHAGCGAVLERVLYIILW